MEAAGDSVVARTWWWCLAGVLLKLSAFLSMRGEQELAKPKPVELQPDWSQQQSDGGTVLYSTATQDPGHGTQSQLGPSDDYTLPAETGKDAAGANQLSDTGAGPQKDRIAQPTAFRMESCCPGWRVLHVCVLPQVQTQQRSLAESGPCCCCVGGLCTGAVKTDETLVPRRFTTRCCCGWGCVAWQLQPDSPQIPSG